LQFSRQIKTYQDESRRQSVLICLDLSFSCIFVVKTPDFFTSDGDRKGEAMVEQREWEE